MPSSKPELNRQSPSTLDEIREQNPSKEDYLATAHVLLCDLMPDTECMKEDIKSSEMQQNVIKTWATLFPTTVELEDDPWYPGCRIIKEALPRGSYMITFCSEVEATGKPVLGVSVTQMVLGCASIADADARPIPDADSEIEIVLDWEDETRHCLPFRTTCGHGRMSRWHLAHAVCWSILEFLINQCPDKEAIADLWVQLRYFRLAGIIKQGKVYRAHFALTWPRKLPEAWIH